MWTTVRKISKVALLLLAATAISQLALAQHPGVQPRPGPSSQTTIGDTTFVVTPTGHFSPSDPIRNPPGTNFLTTLESNMFDGAGVEMPNTLPSTAANPYNLHDGPVVVSAIDPTSPTNDLLASIKKVRRQARQGHVDRATIRFALDIIEGNPIAGKIYSGFPLLHYIGPLKVKQVVPTVVNGQTVGGNVTVHQIWYDSHIESDTSFIDPSLVREVPWTITYVIDTLDRGHDDFSPFVMYTDDPALTAPGPPAPHVAMDQTFFPMEDGIRSIFKIKMAPGKYYNLTYTWGWRVHPPRVQVSENATKKIAGKSLVEWEQGVFGVDPRADRQAQLTAIRQIGNLSPAKRMWRKFRQARRAEPEEVVRLMRQAQKAFEDWSDRTKLPAGVTVDPAADVTLFYVNNTIYGTLRDGGEEFIDAWRVRPFNLKVTLYNGDNYDHAYVNVDFGGSRGWENQFSSTVPLGGSGCWFTFGRVHWWINAGAPPVGLIVVPAASGGALGMHKVDLTVNFEPSRRLRFYQFDPLHHDVAVWSIH